MTNLQIAPKLYWFGAGFLTGVLTLPLVKTCYHHLDYICKLGEMDDPLTSWIDDDDSDQPTDCPK